MAEVAAGALVAEQVVATGVEAAAVVAIATPTQPLKVSLTQLAPPAAAESSEYVYFRLALFNPMS